MLKFHIFRSVYLHSVSPSMMAFKHSKYFTVMNNFFREIHGNATTHHHYTLSEFQICLLPVMVMLTQLNITIRWMSYNHQQCKAMNKSDM